MFSGQTPFLPPQTLCPGQPAPWMMSSALKILPVRIRAIFLSALQNTGPKTPWLPSRLKWSQISWKNSLSWRIRRERSNPDQMDLNWTRFSCHLISLTQSTKGICQSPGNTSQAMPGVVTVRQPLTILSLTGLSSLPTTEEQDQKLPFTLGKCPVSSTNQSSPIKADPEQCWQPCSAEPGSEDAEEKKEKYPR